MISRKCQVSDYWISEFYFYQAIGGSHPCWNACSEPCEDCLNVAKSFEFLACVARGMDDTALPGLLVKRAKDYSWENGPPPLGGPPRKVANLMPVPQPQVFTDAYSKKSSSKKLS